MLTTKELAEHFRKNRNCSGISCSNCPEYSTPGWNCPDQLRGEHLDVWITNVLAAEVVQMTGNEHNNYIQEINKFYPDVPDRADRFRDNTELIHATLGIAGESGEVVDIIKKHVAYGKSLDLVKLADELGDLFHYMSRVMYLTGISMEEIQTANLTKLRARYPEGYNHTAAISQRDKGEDSGIN
jgi:NTP pyrophosphatase (non-canonical NTP hydrolase)